MKKMRIELPPLVHGWNRIPQWQKVSGSNPCGGKSPFVTRNRTIVEQRILLQLSYKEIAAHWGISAQRCRQIYNDTMIAFWGAMERENDRWERDHGHVR